MPDHWPVANSMMVSPLVSSFRATRPLLQPRVLPTSARMMGNMSLRVLAVRRAWLIFATPLSSRS